MIRARLEVRGIVQGVGFRPFIHRMVKSHGFNGWVRNTSSGADMELEGDREDIARFADEIRYEHPPLALIESVTETELEGLCGYEDFRIVKSDKGEKMQTLVSPDVGICDDCLRELLTPSDRRYRYPFINCTNCGPRFTIIKSVPYDRATTSMAAFPMCEKCAAEFTDIEDRRYHAQPDCCPTCGPRVFFIGSDGAEIQGDAIEAAREYIKSGNIIAVKGLGGMHLACLPDADTARELRRRKQRDEKPFAVMCRDVSCARALCDISTDEEKLLTSFRKPIVLLKKKRRGSYPELSENNYLGVMLPYTPLHVLLFGSDIDCLIMTSANLSDTPIMYQNDEAMEKLRGIADGFLMHNRDIQTRCDDSLVRVWRGKDYPLRRSRGYVPYPVLLPVKVQGLACGAEQKASFCVSKEGHAFPCQHIGDLKNMETLQNYTHQIAHFERLFDISPSFIACDLHPDYMSTEYAQQRAQSDGKPLYRIQHHHAHMASCMADNGLSGECLGLIWDGTGYGTDGTTWGGELLCGGYKDFRRLGSILPIPLPGGDAAVKGIWRVGEAMLRMSGAEGVDFPGHDTAVVDAMLDRNVNCPPSSGMGRLFDGACAVMGIRADCSYEGQGAILLEAAYEPSDGRYAVEFIDCGGVDTFDWRPMIREITADVLSGVSAGVMAAKFMNTVCEMALRQCAEAAKAAGLDRIVLSGGVFQNMYIMERLPKMLEDAGLHVFTHSRVSCNDEGISLGQLMIAEERFNCDVSCGTAENC